MTRSTLAEFVLSLVFPGDRAQAATGDLLEQAGSRGALWFWTAVLRTVGWQTWREWITAPLDLAVEAFLLWLQFIAGSVILALAAYLVWGFVYLMDNHTGLELLTTWWGTRVPSVPPAWIAYWMGVCVLPTLGAWMKGIEVAVKSRGNELALWIAVALVWTFMGIATKLPLSTLVAPPLALLAGMLRTRWNGIRPSLR